VNRITEHIDIWTAAQTPKTNGAGRGNGSARNSLHGIKKLRELILELAVRGKLVPQDPTDLPASDLLEKITREKARLIKEGKIKKQKPLPEISEDEKPFELPAGWEWARIGDIGHDWGQKTPENDFTYIEVSAIDNVAGIVKSPITLKSSEAPSRARKIVQVGTVIYSTVRPYLKNICVIEQKYSPEPIASTAFAILHPLQKMPGRFIAFYLKSPVFVKYVESIQTGIAYPAINDKQFFGGVISIPPLAEQHRIVAKVDELMALCDQLEQQQIESSDTHQILVETLLATLTNAADQKECAKAWQRIANHFDTLFTTEHSIEQLKQTILQLAVMGKLVPQDPDDEPAIELLKNLANARDKWLKENAKKNKECATMQRKLKKLKSANPPFSIPATWECTHLIQLTRMLVDCHNKTAPYVEKGIPIIRTSNIREREFHMYDVKFVNEGAYNYWSRRCPPTPQDIIFTREAPMGEAAIIPEGKTYCLGQRTMLIRPMHEYISNKYLLLALTEPHLLERASEYAIGSTVKHLRVGNVENLNIPIPPLAEQHRIVAKVDELMAICDALKARLNEAQNTQVKLADAIVEQAVA